MEGHLADPWKHFDEEGQMRHAVHAYYLAFEELTCNIVLDFQHGRGGAPCSFKSMLEPSIQLTQHIKLTQDYFSNSYWDCQLAYIG